MDKEMEQKIGQLQLIEQNMQSLGMQKQNFQAALIECENALNELSKSKTGAYRIVGGIMISSDVEELKKELNSKKDVLNLRIKNIETQENSIGEKAKRLQEEVVEKLKKK
jgi:prefoldin beta subunit